jgi:hypothetical protein
LSSFNFHRPLSHLQMPPNGSTQLVESHQSNNIRNIDNSLVPLFKSVWSRGPISRREAASVTVLVRVIIRFVGAKATTAKLLVTSRLASISGKREREHQRHSLHVHTGSGYPVVLILSLCQQL